MSGSSESDRLPGIDAIKAIAIIGVVIGHMPIEGDSEPAARVLEILQFLLTSWAPLAFFWASGFLTQLSLEKRPKTWLQLVSAKARRLLVPFILLVTINSLALWALSKTSILNPALLPWNNEAPGIYYYVRLIPGAGHYFFLYLFLVSFIFDRIITLKRGTILTALAASIIVIGLLSLWGGLPAMSHGPWPDLIGVYSLSYVLGACHKKINTGKKWPRLAAIAGVAIMVITGLIGNVPSLLWMLCAPSLFILFRKLPKTAMLLQKTQLGKKSGAIFAWHSPFVLVGISALLFFVSQNSLITIVGSLVGTLAVCYLIDAVVRRYRILRWLIV